MKSLFEKYKGEEFKINDIYEKYTLEIVANEYIGLKNSYELKIIPFTSITEVNLDLRENEIKTTYFDWQEFLDNLGDKMHNY